MKKLSLLLLISFLLFIITGCGNDEEKPISTIPYEIIKSEDAGSKRLKISVVVKEKVTKEGLQKLSDQIFEDQKKTAQPFTALFIRFYDHPGYIDYYSMPLGQSEYLPNGDYNQVHKITPGNYQNFKGSYQLKEKDWDKQPSKAEADLAHQYSIWLYDPKNDDREDEEVLAEFCKNNNLDPVKVEEVNTKVLLWTSF